MKALKIALLAIFLLQNSIGIKAQAFFRGALIGGINASQIDGDQLAGYDKVGATAGLKVEFPLSQSFDGSMEFLFSQRGSRSALIKGQFNDISRIHLNYIEIPLLIKWSDWWIEEEAYYKFNVHGGFSGGRLINYSTNFSENAIRSNLNNYDLSFLLGLGFAITKKWTVSARYTRSINRLYKVEETNSQNQFSALLGYFITLRTEYYLN